jgi:hypothetical protein
MADISMEHILNAYSSEQLAVLSKFKGYIQTNGDANSLFDDVFLLRFLKARKFDFKKTCEMWNNYLNWRKEERLDEPFEFPEFNEIKKFFPHLYFRTDKQGRPIYIERVGQLKHEEIWKATTQERFLKYYARHNERMITQILPACSAAAGKRLHQGIYIIDLKGMTWKTASSGVLDLVKAIMGMCQKYYPELMGEMFVVNAPMLFYGVWNIIKLGLDDRTKQKIHILGSGYKKKLLEKIDEANLPDFLEGKATVEEYGKYLTNEQGPWVSRDTKY